jgi:hypothetical protein
MFNLPPLFIALMANTPAQDFENGSLFVTAMLG